MNRNGYFKLIRENGCLYLSAVPAEGNGKTIGIDTLITYFDKKGVDYGSVTELKAAMDKCLRGEKVQISPNDIIPFAGWCEYSNQNYLNLIFSMYPPVEGVPPVTKEDVLRDLKSMKVVYGIREDIIDLMISEQRYFEPVIIAKALDPIEGHDAELTYNFNTKITAKPTINEDGSVDFHQLDLINHVKSGDVVAQIKPEDPGKEGMNIMGIPIKPKKVSRKTFKYGRNLSVSEDGLKLISMVSGHVSLEGDKIFVSDEYSVKTDVDNSTGNIDYDGNVTIVGNVRAGFSVKATGNVNVNGVVEGAEIIAGGDIVLQRGILGMNRGVLRAEGSIIATYIENATVSAGKNLEADAILHSKVTVDGTIEVHGKNGYIIGGEVRAGSLISAKIIGSSMGTNTVLAVGINPELVAKINGHKEKISSLSQDKVKLNQIVELLRKKQETEGKLDAVKAEYLQKSMKNLIMIDQQLKEHKAAYLELSANLCEDSDAKIKVFGSIYSGVKIEFSNQSYFVKDKNDFCQFVKRGPDITRIGM